MKITNIAAAFVFATIATADQVVERQYNPWSGMPGAFGAADGGSSGFGATWKDHKRDVASASEPAGGVAARQYNPWSGYPGSWGAADGGSSSFGATWKDHHKRSSEESKRSEEIAPRQYNPWSGMPGAFGAADGGSSGFGATWKDHKRSEEVVPRQYNPWSGMPGAFGAADGGSSGFGATWKDHKRSEPSGGGWSVMIPKGIMPSDTKINGLPVDINLNESPLLLHDRPEEVVLPNGVIDYHSLHPETLRKMIEHIEHAPHKLDPEQHDKRDTAILPGFDAQTEQVGKDEMARGGVACPAWCNSHKDHWRCHIPLPAQCYCYNEKCLRPGAKGDPMKFKPHGFPINGVMYPEGLSG